MKRQTIIAMLTAGAAIQSATGLPVGEAPKTPDQAFAALRAGNERLANGVRGPNVFFRARLPFGGK